MLAHPIELRRTEAERLDRAVAGTDAQDRSPGRDLLSVAAAAAVTEARRVPKLVTHVPSSMRSVTVAATVSDAQTSRQRNSESGSHATSKPASSASRTHPATSSRADRADSQAEANSHSGDSTEPPDHLL